MPETIKNKRDLADALENLDKEVRAWSKLTRKKMLFQLASLGLKERARVESESPGLYKSVRSSVKRNIGEIESASFSFARHGIFLEHGVGRGRPVRSPQAIASKKQWLAPTLPDAVEALADLLEQRYADVTTANIRFLIPGIFDTKISR